MRKLEFTGKLSLRLSGSPRMSTCKKPCVEQTTNLEKFDPEILSEIEQLFAKKFSYAKPLNNEWQLPDPSDAFTCDHKEFNSLLDLKNSMNEVKNQLSDKNLIEWHQHTSFTNKAGKIIPHVKKSVNAELCTQAWCKFHEILCSFPLLPADALQEGQLNSVHLCEAPGAFIASLNHYLKSHHIHCDWNWVANTLNPYHEANDTLMMIMDDRLIANTLPWWHFGPDNTGDVMSLKHLTGLQSFPATSKAGNSEAYHVIPESFLKIHEECCMFFHKCQTGCSMNAKWFGQRNKYFSTYNERKMLETLTWNDKVAKGYLNHVAEEHSVNNAGKRLPAVKCSPFCDGQVLENLNEAMSELVGRPRSSQVPQLCHSCEVLTGEQLAKGDALGLPNPVIEYLQHLHNLMSSLLDSDSPKQVLQFVPMESLLQGKLLEFLWDLNTAIAKRQLHLLVQAKQLQMTGYISP
ncbi:UNVERIFIED_CONTAM: hypothetical protein H355_003123 [Colinus virginianus]|nr:hypothetical protein H355_003123 [Colinus virginianus]